MNPISALPFKVVEDGTFPQPTIVDANGRDVARVYSYKDDAHALVEAANCHRELVEACKAMNIANTPATIDEAFELIRAAIAKAEGRTP